MLTLPLLFNHWPHRLVVSPSRRRLAEAETPGFIFSVYFMYYIYLLINETSDKTYIGFTDNVERRIREHRNKKVKSTKNFGKFKGYIINKTNSIKQAREKEKYYKSTSGRRKLKIFFE